MKKNKNILLLIAGFIVCLIAFTAFSKVGLPSTQLIGEWRNVYVKVIMHSKTKPAATMEADSSNWEARLGIKPIHKRQPG